LNFVILANLVVICCPNLGLNHKWLELSLIWEIISLKRIHRVECDNNTDISLAHISITWVGLNNTLYWKCHIWVLITWIIKCMLCRITISLYFFNYQIKFGRIKSNFILICLNLITNAILESLFHIKKFIDF
jgi:hypothetical protein